MAANHWLHQVSALVYLVSMSSDFNRGISNKVLNSNSVLSSIPHNKNVKRRKRRGLGQLSAALQAAPYIGVRLNYRKGVYFIWKILRGI